MKSTLKTKMIAELLVTNHLNKLIHLENKNVVFATKLNSKLLSKQMAKRMHFLLANSKETQKFLVF